MCPRWLSVARDARWNPDNIVYSWGDGITSGHGTRVDSPKLLYMFFTPIRRLQIKSMVACNSATFAVTHGGHVYRWGMVLGQRTVATPERIVELEKQHIVQVP